MGADESVPISTSANSGPGGVGTSAMSFLVGLFEIGSPRLSSSILNTTP